MKITKYIHSCLLVEGLDRVALIDPGQFSFESGLLDITKLSRLDDLIITHEHFDHFYLRFVEAVLRTFPDVNVTTTSSILAQLQQSGLQPKIGDSNAVSIFSAAHEPLEPLGKAPDNIGVHYLNELTHPGDCHHFTESKKILALPMTAPWGTVMRAAQLGLELRPQIIIPIHDWHWNSEARKSFYQTFESFFGAQGIHFLKLEDGISVEV